MKPHWAFVSICTLKRLIQGGANGFKPDNVPSSLRDTGCCHTEHAGLPPSPSGDSHLNPLAWSPQGARVGPDVLRCFQVRCAWTSICVFLGGGWGGIWFIYLFFFNDRTWATLNRRPQLRTECSSHAGFTGSKHHRQLVSAPPSFRRAVELGADRVASRGARELPGASSPHCRLPIPNTCPPFFMFNRLFMARDRQTWLTSESIFQVIIWLAQALL